MLSPDIASGKGGPMFHLEKNVVDPLPPPKTDAELNPPILSNQQLLEKNIDEALKESAIVYEQTGGNNFVGA